MEIKENCSQWIKLAYDDWLTWVRTHTPEHYLRVSTKNIVDKMKEAASDSSRWEVAWNTLERLKRLANNFSNMGEDGGGENYKYEPAEIYLECAIAAYHMEDVNEAISLLRNPPVSGFRMHSLHRAINHWVLGCVQWQLQSHLEDALASWERSLQITKDVRDDVQTNRAMMEKCKDIQTRMEDAIRYASEHNYPPPAPSSAGSARKNARASINSHRTTLRTFPIIGSIPAGTPVEMNIKPDDWLEYASFNIFNGKHDCYSLRGENLINIQPGKKYYLLKVTGNSMNLSAPVNIENGDFVLMIQQEVADPGDIVAAEIINDDPEATLKRYLFQNGYHVLQPESDDPQFQKKMLMKQDIYIRGIALAVLKSS